MWLLGAGIGGGMESYYLIGREFQFCKIRKVLKMDGDEAQYECT